MVQWIGICLPMQRMWVWSLVWKNLTCPGATKPIHHNYWSPHRACAPKLENSPCSPQLEKAHTQQQKTSCNQKITINNIKKIHLLKKKTHIFMLFAKLIYLNCLTLFLYSLCKLYTCNPKSHHPDCCFFLLRVNGFKFLILTRMYRII